LCARLRGGGYRGAILVLEADDGIAALEHGADGVLPWPMTPEELMAHVRAVLRRVPGHPGFRWGVLRVDLAEHVAYARDRPLRLTAREYALLACLVEASGRTVTRSELLKRVWRRSTSAGSNLVEAHLSRLRDKLGPDAGIIETVRGGGYRLRDGL
jgi:two-component system phosphate regulon response regulator PhoB